MMPNECMRNRAQGVPTNGGSERPFSLPYGTGIMAGVLWPLSRIIFLSSQGPHDVHLKEEKQGGLESFGVCPRSVSQAAPRQLASSSQLCLLLAKG